MVETVSATITDIVEFYDITLMNPKVLVGVFVGAMMAFLFCGLTMNAVGRAAEKMVVEVRRQFREIAGILEGKQRPDYTSCVRISTKAAQHEMVFPSVLAIVVPMLVGVLLGPAGVIGLLAGGLGAGFVLAIFLANSGGAWDNAKKYVEEGHFGGKNSASHHATVVGDTVGDPFKDTSSVALNPIIKFTTLFGLLAMEMAISENFREFAPWVGIVFVIVAIFFVWRSFYKMRIDDTIDNIINASLEELQEINTVGETIAQSIRNFFDDERNIEIINRLKAFGLQFSQEKKVATENQVLAGKTIVVSGVFTNFSRDGIKQKIEDLGGKNSSSISSKTDFVVAGEKMGPEKLKKAEALGIKIIDETEFLNMIK